MLLVLSQTVREWIPCSHFEYMIMIVENVYKWHLPSDGQSHNHFVCISSLNCHSDFIKKVLLLLFLWMDEEIETQRRWCISYVKNYRATKQCSPTLNPFPSPQGAAFHMLSALWCGWEVCAESRGLFLYANEPHFPPLGWRRRFTLVTTESTFPSLLCFWLQSRISHSNDIFYPWSGCLHYTLSCVLSFPRVINGHLSMKQMFRALGLAKINTDNLNTEVSGMFLVHFYFPTIKNDELEWMKVLLLLGQTKPSQTANLIATKPLLIKSTILSNYIIHKCLFCLVVKDDMNFYSYLAGNSAQWSKAWVLESKGLDPKQLLSSFFLWPWTHCLISLCVKRGYYHCI